MSEEIQIRDPRELLVQGNPVFQTVGDWNTQIGYIGQQINNISMGAAPCAYKPHNPNYDYYNLFVVEQEQLDGILAIPKKLCLNDYTDKEVKDIYALPGLAAAEEIKRLPSLFVIRNRFGNYTTVDQLAGYGYVVDIQLKGETVVVTAAIRQVIVQNKLNGHEKELKLLTAPENNELDQIHWAIKRVNLPELINKNKMIDIMDAL